MTVVAHHIDLHSNDSHQSFHIICSDKKLWNTCISLWAGLYLVLGNNILSLSSQAKTSQDLQMVSSVTFVRHYFSIFRSVNISTNESWIALWTHSLKSLSLFLYSSLIYLAKQDEEQDDDVCVKSSINAHLTITAPSFTPLGCKLTFTWTPFWKKQLVNNSHISLVSTCTALVKTNTFCHATVCHSGVGIRLK